MNKTFKMFIVIIVVIVIGGIYFYKNSSTNYNNLDISNNSENVPILIEFTSKTCPVCEKIKPVISEIKKEYKEKINIKIIDVYKHKNFARQYNIRVVPTFIFLDSNGNKVYRHEGLLEKKEFISKFKEMGVE